MIVDVRTQLSAWDELLPSAWSHSTQEEDALDDALAIIYACARKPDPTIASLAHCYIENVSYYDREVGHERMKTRIRAFSPCQEARRILSQR